MVSTDVKLGCQCNNHKGRAAIRHYANQPAHPLLHRLIVNSSTNYPLLTHNVTNNGLPATSHNPAASTMSFIQNHFVQKECSNLKLSLPALQISIIYHGATQDCKIRNNSSWTFPSLSARCQQAAASRVQLMWSYDQAIIRGRQGGGRGYL